MLSDQKEISTSNSIFKCILNTNDKERKVSFCFLGYIWYPVNMSPRCSRPSIALRVCGFVLGTGMTAALYLNVTKDTSETSQLVSRKSKREAGRPHTPEMLSGWALRTSLDQSLSLYPSIGTDGN